MGIKMFFLMRKLNHKDPDIRKNAIAKVTDQNLLADIAKKARKKAVRGAATKKITDQAVLADVAKNDIEWDVRSVAVCKVTDQAVLADIAKNDANEYVRKNAAENITDQAVLVYIAKAAGNLREREAAEEKITDQALLADIAKNAEYNSVREAAVRKITDQSVLIDVVKNDTELEVRKVAVKKITDQTLLADIAKNDGNWSVRRTAAEKITDQTVLADVAKQDTDWNVRIVAVKKVTDQALLADIAKNGASSARKLVIAQLEVVGGKKAVPILLDCLSTNSRDNAVVSLARLAVREGIEPFKLIVEYLSNGPEKGKGPAEKALQEALVMAEKGVKANGGESLKDLTKEVLHKRILSFIDHLSTKVKESSDTDFCNRITDVLKWAGENEIGSQLKINEDEFSYGYYLCFGSADAAKEYYDLIAAQHDNITELISWRARLELRNKPGVLYPHWVVIYTPSGTLRFFNKEVGLPLEYDDHDEGGQALIKANSTSELIGGLDINGKVTKEKELMMDVRPYCTICGEEVVGEHRKIQTTADFKTPTKEIAPGMHIPLSKPVTVYICTNTNQCQRTGEYNLTKLGICEQCGYVYFPEGGWMMDLADKMEKESISDFEINCPKCKKSLNFTKEDIKKCWSSKFGD